MAGWPLTSRVNSALREDPGRSLAKFNSTPPVIRTESTGVTLSVTVPEAGRAPELVTVRRTRFGPASTKDGRTETPRIARS